MAKPVVGDYVSNNNNNEGLVHKENPQTDQSLVEYDSGPERWEPNSDLTIIDLDD